MINLDYQTDNPRWGWTGMKFTDWNSFAFTLGFLSSIRHFQGYGRGKTIWDDSILIRAEQNDRQGAWEYEGRIHYYKLLPDLQNTLPDLFACKSAGNGNITCRINSNGYIDSLIYDFGFVPIITPGRLTIDVYPPQIALTSVGSALQNHLVSIGLSSAQINFCMVAFNDGWNL